MSGRSRTIVNVMRHGEVHNPEGILYGRLPDYHLSKAGREMAQAAADHVASLDRPVAALYSSPLERAQEAYLRMKSGKARYRMVLAVGGPPQQASVHGASAVAG